MKKIMIGKCSMCGKEYSCHFFARRSKIKKYMITNHVCSNCAAWVLREKDPEARDVIIDGILYCVYQYQSLILPGDFLGGKGKMQYFVDLDTTISFMSNDVWRWGPVPDGLGIKDNAVRITRRECYALRDGFFECQGISCLDRYTCAFYFDDIEKDSGPANKIPDNWKDGDELCSNYLNKNNISKIIMEWRNRKLLEKRT